MLAIAITVAPRKSLRRIPAWAAASGGFLRLLRRAVVGICMLLLTLTSPASAQAPDVAEQPATESETISIEQEVLDNILRQPLGDTTVESLDLPQSFLRRVAGRIIRSSYQHRYHIVAPDASLKPLDGSPPSAGSTTATDREEASLDSSEQNHGDRSKTWLYLVGLAILIGTAAGVLALRSRRRARR